MKKLKLYSILVCILLLGISCANDSNDILKETNNTPNIIENDSKENSSDQTDNSESSEDNGDKNELTGNNSATFIHKLISFNPKAFHIQYDSTDSQNTVISFQYPRAFYGSDDRVILKNLVFHISINGKEISTPNEIVFEYDRYAGSFSGIEPGPYIDDLNDVYHYGYNVHLNTTLKKGDIITVYLESADIYGWTDANIVKLNYLKANVIDISPEVNYWKPLTNCDETYLSLTDEFSNELLLDIYNPFIKSDLNINEYKIYIWEDKRTYEQKYSNSNSIELSYYGQYGCGIPINYEYIEDEYFSRNAAFASLSFMKQEESETKQVILKNNTDYVFEYYACDELGNPVFNYYIELNNRYNLTINYQNYFFAFFGQSNFKSGIEAESKDFSPLVPNQIYTSDRAIRNLLFENSHESFWIISDRIILELPLFETVKWYIFNGYDSMYETEVDFSFWYYTTEINNANEIVTIHIINDPQNTPIANTTDKGLFRFNKTTGKLIYADWDGIIADESTIIGEINGWGAYSWDAENNCISYTLKD